MRRRRRSIRRPDQHGIAVGEEAVALLNRVPVGIKDQLATCQRGHQHQQGRFRQVEIGNQAIDAADAVARIEILNRHTLADILEMGFYCRLQEFADILLQQLLSFPIHVLFL